MGRGVWSPSDEVSCVARIVDITPVSRRDEIECDEAMEAMLDTVGAALPPSFRRVDRHERDLERELEGARGRILWANSLLAFVVEHEFHHHAGGCAVVVRPSANQAFALRHLDRVADRVFGALKAEGFRLSFRTGGYTTEPA